MNYLYLDAETIPSQEPWAKDLVKDVTAPANYKDEEKIAAYIAEKQDEAHRKLSFDGAANHIICISAALNDLEPVSFYAETAEREKGLLGDFYDWFLNLDLFGNYGQPANGVCLVGHNIIGFDLKVLRHRSIILGVRPPDWIPFNTKPWETNQVYDTMTQWDAKNFVGLDKLCKAMGIPGKDGFDGSMVYDAWLAGEHERIKAYCADDTRRVRALHKRMTFMGV